MRKKKFLFRQFTSYHNRRSYCRNRPCGRVSHLPHRKYHLRNHNQIINLRDGIPFKSQITSPTSFLNRQRQLQSNRLIGKTHPQTEHENPSPFHPSKPQTMSAINYKALVLLTPTAHLNTNISWRRQNRLQHHQTPHSWNHANLSVCLSPRRQGISRSLKLPNKTSRSRSQHACSLNISRISNRLNHIGRTSARSISGIKTLHPSTVLNRFVPSWKSWISKTATSDILLVSRRQ